MLAVLLVMCRQELTGWWSHQGHGLGFAALQQVEGRCSRVADAGAVSGRRAGHNVKPEGKLSVTVAAAGSAPLFVTVMV